MIVLYGNFFKLKEKYVYIHILFCLMRQNPKENGNKNKNIKTLNRKETPTELLDSLGQVVYHFPAFANQQVFGKWFFYSLIYGYFDRIQTENHVFDKPTNVAISECLKFRFYI